MQVFYSVRHKPSSPESGDRGIAGQRSPNAGGFRITKLEDPGFGPLSAGNLKPGARQAPSAALRSRRIRAKPLPRLGFFALASFNGGWNAAAVIAHMPILLPSNAIDPGARIPNAIRIQINKDCLQRFRLSESSAVETEADDLLVLYNFLTPVNTLAIASAEALWSAPRSGTTSRRARARSRKHSFFCF